MKRLNTAAERGHTTCQQSLRLNQHFAQSMPQSEADKRARGREDH